VNRGECRAQWLAKRWLAAVCGRFPWRNLANCSPKSCYDHLGPDQACMTGRLKMVDGLWILWIKRLRSA
jgi:hypothetical protein